MQEKPDIELLREYAEHGNETAFREIVSRHADVVFATALRQAGSPDLARDIAQNVFTDLAHKARALAGKLAGDASLLGWLYRATRFAALNQLRDDRRRQARERHAMQQFDPASETAPEWERVRPVLDEAMAELSEEDREVLLLRFFKDRDFRAIAAALGVSDDAAQKRVSRALERLRAGLTSRGVTTTTGALSAVLVASTNSVAPVGLAATLSTAALAGATLATTATATASKAIAMTTLQKTLIAATLTIAVAAGIYEVRQNSRLRKQNQTLKEQQATLTAQMEQITRERENVTNQLAALRDENERLNRNTVELLKLRGEVATLRQNQPRAQSAEEETAQLRVALAKSQSTVERLEFEKLDQNVAGDMNRLVLAMRVRPRDYNGFMATNFYQLISELAVKTNENGAVVFSQSGNELALFEFMNVGKVNDTLPQKLIFREKTPRRTPDGNWTRIYGRADGSVQKRFSPTGNFEQWESLSERPAP